ncbi:MAG: penicillin-binding protein 2 [Firmicutes bacterium]|nr:penicillin-binding protein 2 [Bacillota bacterium]
MAHKRLALIGWLTLTLLLLIIAVLALLIFGRGARLQAAALEQRLRSMPYYQYERGDILDRQGRPLVNLEESCLVVLPTMLQGREEETAAALSRLLGIGETAARERLEQAAAAPGQPQVLLTGLTAEQIGRIEEAALPGVLALTLAARYDRQHTACQLLGSVQQTSEGGWQGVSGLERQYDSLLSARQDAELRLQVDARGSLSREAELYRPGQTRVPTLCLTLDRDYQQIAEQALAESGLAGSCVILDPQNGDILALASWPLFDPYGWQPAADGAYLQRALQLYPPASTFKTVLAAAALTEGVTPESGRSPSDAPAGETAAPDAGDAANTGETDNGITENGETEAPADTTDADGAAGTFVCTGSCTLPDGRTVSCAGGQAHGEVDLSRALALSCNCCFVALGQALGGEELREYCRRLLPQELTVIGLELPEASGCRLEFRAEQAGELANVCLGEDGIGVSPLQEAVLFSVFVNGGRLVTPRLVTAVDDGAGGRRDFPAAVPRQVLEPETAEELRRMLTGVVEDGTGAAARGLWVSAGGKTGSSETGTVWFSGFFPAERPRLTVTVCLEQGSSGGTEAAAVFRQVADAITLLDGGG